MSSSNTLELAKQPDNKYVVYLDKPHTVNDNSISYPTDAKGFIVATTKKGKRDVKVIGGGEHVQLFGKRQISIWADSSSKCDVNGVVVQMRDSQWIQDKATKLECFVEVRNNEVFLDMLTNGVYCVNYTTLIEVSNVSMKPPLVAKHLDILEKVPNDLKAVYLNGDILDESMIKREKGLLSSTILFPTKISLTEQMYLEYPNSTFQDIIMPTLKLPQFYIPVDFNGKFNFLANCRAYALNNQPISHSQEKQTVVKLQATRYNRETVNLDLVCNWLSPIQSAVREIKLKAVHKLQELTVNYDNFNGIGDSRKIVSIKGKDSLSVVVGVKGGEFICVMDDKTEYKSVVCVELVPYTTKDAGVFRFDDNHELVHQSDGFYIVNSKVHETKNNTVVIKLQAGTANVGFYSKKDAVWEVTDTRIKPDFDKNYVYNVFGQQKTEIPMSIFGLYDGKDKFNYSIKGGKSLAKGRYVLEIPKGKATGETISEITFIASQGEKLSRNNSFSASTPVASRGGSPLSASAIDLPPLLEEDEKFSLEEEPKYDENKFEFTVKFVSETFSRVSFILKGDDKFSVPTQQRGSISRRSRSEGAFYTYGVFFAEKGKSICAYNTKVDWENPPTMKNKFPLITFLEPNIGIISNNENSLPISTSVLEEDLVIDNVTKYVRLNNCNDVKFENDKLTVSSKTGVCIFRANDSIHLCRSNLTKSVSFMNTETPSVSQNASPVSSPKEDPKPEPPKQSAPPKQSETPRQPEPVKQPQKEPSSSGIVPKPKTPAPAPTQPKTAPVQIKTTPVINTQVKSIASPITQRSLPKTSVPAPNPATPRGKVVPKTPTVVSLGNTAQGQRALPKRPISAPVINKTAVATVPKKPEVRKKATFRASSRTTPSMFPKKGIVDMG